VNAHLLVKEYPQRLNKWADAGAIHRRHIESVKVSERLKACEEIIL
jgi:hypothetical protein